MQDSTAAHPCRTTTPWNRGKLIGPKPPLIAKEIWSIRVRLQVAHRVRDLALFNLALDSKLRACDLVALRVDDVALNGRVRSRATVIQRKTGRPVQFEITEQTREAVGRWLEKKDLHKGEPLFPSRINRRKSMTTRQYARLLSYRSMVNRKRYRQQCEEHLQILDLLERERNEEASQALRRHLEHTIGNLQEIRPILEH
jgi:integrase